MYDYFILDSPFMIAVHSEVTKKVKTKLYSLVFISFCPGNIQAIVANKDNCFQPPLCIGLVDNTDISYPHPPPPKVK